LARLKSGRPCGPGKAGADAPVISLRLRFLSPGRCLSVFSLCFLLLCCSCFSGFISLKVNVMNIMMATAGLDSSVCSQSAMSCEFNGSMQRYP